MSSVSETALSPRETVTKTLEHYAERGVFRGFSVGAIRGGKAMFRILWHRDRVFDFVFDENKETMRFPLVLPNVPSDSSMYKEFKEFVKSRQAEALPNHRRIDEGKAQVKPYNRGGNVSVTLKVKDGDFEYGTQRLVNLVHEIYMVFLYDGSYYEYMVEHLGLDPDGM